MGRQGLARPQIEQWIKNKNPTLIGMTNKDLYHEYFIPWAKEKQVNNPVSLQAFNREIKPIKDKIKAKIKVPKSAKMTAATQAELEAQAMITMKKKITRLQYYFRQVGAKRSNGCIIYGPTGIGKTFQAISTIEHMGYKRKVHYDHYKGVIQNALQLYKYMYRNRDYDLLVVDDTKGLIGRNEDCGNIISAALDSNKASSNTISFQHKELWDQRDIDRLPNGPRKEKAIPNEFECSTRMIFLTNQNIDNISEAIGSRLYPYDFSLSKDELLCYIRLHIDTIYDSPIETKKKVIDFLRAKKDDIDRFDIRAFEQCCEIYDTKDEFEHMADWKEFAMETIADKS